MRHTCRHIRAWGKLRAVRQQQQQSKVLAALATWAATGRQFRCQLLRRCWSSWMSEAAGSRAQLQAAVAHSAQQRKHAVLRAWWQHKEDQVRVKGWRVGAGAMCHCMQLH
jgi:integrase